MHYNVEPALHGKIELLAEEKRLPVPVPSPRFELLLRFRRRLVFVIVDARLSDRADVGQLCKLAYLLQEVVCGLVHVKWAATAIRSRLWGWMPTAARTMGCLSARSTARRQLSSVVLIVMIFDTPAPCARARTSERSSA